jgi:integrase
MTMEPGSRHPQVQEMLGHKTIVTTLDTYSHVLPVLHGEAIRVLDAWLDVRARFADRFKPAVQP